MISFEYLCWFLGKNLSNFVPSVWKLHNPYWHTVGGKLSCTGSIGKPVSILSHTLKHEQKCLYVLFPRLHDNLVLIFLVRLLFQSSQVWKKALVKVQIQFIFRRNRFPHVIPFASTVSNGFCFICFLTSGNLNQVICNCCKNILNSQKYEPASRFLYPSYESVCNFLPKYAQVSMNL